MQTRVPMNYSLVIGCHDGLEQFHDSDVENGKILISKLVGVVASKDISHSTKMPSNYKAILENDDSRMFLIFVGHSDDCGRLQLAKLQNEIQESVCPMSFFAGLDGCRGKLTMFLYTCYSHLWVDAYRKYMIGGPGRIFSVNLSIEFRVCTQSIPDQQNQKTFYYSVRDLHSTPVGQKSEGEVGKGHRHLSFDILQSKDALSNPEKLPIDLAAVNTWFLNKEPK